jgi:hypothetical protein
MIFAKGATGFFLVPDIPTTAITRLWYRSKTLALFLVPRGRAACEPHTVLLPSADGIEVGYPTSETLCAAWRAELESFSHAVRKMATASSLLIFLEASPRISLKHSVQAVDLTQPNTERSQGWCWPINRDIEDRDM